LVTTRFHHGGLGIVEGQMFQILVMVTIPGSGQRDDADWI
jgi:hypothetical protein